MLTEVMRPFVGSAVATEPSDGQADLPYVVLGAYLTCFAVYNLSWWVSPLVSESYRALKRRDAIEWHMQLVATVHAAVSSQAAIRCFILEESTVFDDWRTGYSPLYEWWGCCTLGYFLYDTTTNVYHFRELRKSIVLVHHGMGIGATAFTIFGRQGQMYALAGYDHHPGCVYYY
jgi:TLC domain-containing protein